jgi:hypothetical protein
MPSFAVYDSQGRAPAHFDLAHAHLLGADDMPLPTPVSFASGAVRFQRPGDDSVALCVQFDVDAPREGHAPLGRLLLRTTLLEPREAPYLLSLELARYRLMLLLTKLEEWDLFTLPPDDAALRPVDEARELFARALCAWAPAGTPGADPAAADTLARRCLAVAVDAMERLALAHAERQVPLRAAGKLFERAAVAYARASGDAGAVGGAGGAGQIVPLGSPAGASLGVAVATPPIVGCVVNPAAFNEPAQRVVQSACDFVSVPMRWVEVEPEESSYAWATTDRWIEWAVRTAKMPVMGGPLLDLRPSSLPEWLFIWENDYETLRELVIEHVQQVVTRYRRTVARWTVASGLNTGASFNLSPEQVIDLTRIAVLIVRKLHPAAPVQVEIAQPWGEHHARQRRTLPPLLYMEAIRQANLPVDAFAVRLQMGADGPGQACRDLGAVSALLDRFASLDKPLTVTCCGVPAGPTPAPTGVDAPTAPEEVFPSGSWRGPWSESLQADWLSALAAVVFSKPGVQALCWQDAIDTTTAREMPLGGLLTAAGTPRAAAQRLAQVRAALREKRAIPARLPGGPRA